DSPTEKAVFFAKPNAFRSAGDCCHPRYAVTSITASAAIATAAAKTIFGASGRRSRSTVGSELEVDELRAARFGGRQKEDHQEIRNRQGSPGPERDVGFLVVPTNPGY